jgi:hypothetical protein
MPKSYAPQVIADNSGQWVGNALRFATWEEAEKNVFDLSMRWTLVRETRVVESDDPVNYRYIDGRLIAVEEEKKPEAPKDGSHLQPIICVICERPIPAKGDWRSGNNAEPAAKGRCCDECDRTVVIPLRIADLYRRQK